MAEDEKNVKVEMGTSDLSPSGVDRFFAALTGMYNAISNAKEDMEKMNKQMDQIEKIVKDGTDVG